MNGDAFADAVAIANFHAGRFASILQILVYFADGGKLIDLVIATNFSMAIHDNVRLQYGTLTNFNMGSNNTKRSNVGIGTNTGALFHNGGRVNKGGFINHVLGLPATGTHHRCFAHNFTVNQCNPFKTGQATARFLESDFHDHLIARYDRTLEACFIDTSEIIQLAWLQFSYAFKRQNTRCLGHCFQNQHARENRFTREVALEERLVNGYIFHCAQKTTFFKIQHTINQQKRKTVRQKF
ncbi:hypothetical protein D3C81_1558830 [compost metagenome]